MPVMKAFFMCVWYGLWVFKSDVFCVVVVACCGITFGFVFWVLFGCWFGFVGGFGRVLWGFLFTSMLFFLGVVGVSAC